MKTISLALVKHLDLLNTYQIVPTRLIEAHLLVEKSTIILLQVKLAIMMASIWPGKS